MQRSRQVFDNIEIKDDHVIIIRRKLGTLRNKGKFFLFGVIRRVLAINILHGETTERSVGQLPFKQ